MSRRPRSPSRPASPVNGGTVTGNGTFASGTRVTLLAAPDPGYNFRDWTENGMSVWTLDTYEFTAATNRFLIANFTRAASPLLAIRRAGASVVLSWPTNAVGFTLEQNQDLHSPDWVTATNGVSVVVTNKQAIICPATGDCFYRLVHP